MSHHASPMLHSFVVTAEAGSFVAAAKKLGLSPAAVGQNVKRLEDQFGVVLFTRTTRKMSLTPEGVLLYQRARGPLRELDELDHILSEIREEATGKLRLTAPRFFAERHLMPMIEAFVSLHPKVEIEIDSSDVIRDFVDDPVDVAFRIGTPTDSTRIARPLSGLPLMTVASPQWIEAHGALTHPEQVMDTPCIRYRFPTSRELYRWQYLEGGETVSYDPPSRFVFNDPEMLVDAALRGLGPLQIDRLYAGEQLKSGRLVAMLDDYAVPGFDLFLSYPQRENLPFRTRAFVDFVLRTFERGVFE